MKNLFALLCTAALLAGCGGGASTSPDPQQTDTPTPDSSTSTPTPDPTPSDTTPDTSGSGDGNRGDTAGTGGGSGGSTHEPPRYTVTCNNCRNDLIVNAPGLSYDDDIHPDGPLNAGNQIAEALSDSTYSGITTHWLGTEPVVREGGTDQGPFDFITMETAALEDGPMSWGIWNSNKFDYTYEALLQNQIVIHDGPTWAGRNLAELTGRATYKGTARGNTEGGEITFFALAELTAEFGDSTDNGTISGRISTAELDEIFEALDDEPSTVLTLGAIPLTSDVNGITGKTGAVTGHLNNCIGGCPTPEPGIPETNSVIGVTDVTGSWGGVFRGTTGDGAPEGMSHLQNSGPGGVLCNAQ